MVRRAVPDDAPELVRLRAVMLTQPDGAAPEPGPWLVLPAQGRDDG